MSNGLRLAIGLVLFGAGFIFGKAGDAKVAEASQAAAAERVFELRTYTAEPGRLDDVLARFRDHTTYIFDKHGMKNVAYWVPVDTPQSTNTLVYVIAHPSREAAQRAWQAFRTDSAWIRARTASESAGRIVASTQSVFLKATDFSPIQ